MKTQRMALIILDMFNRLDFPEGKKIQSAAQKAAKKIAQLKKRFHSVKAPVIYVNDNFGCWKADWKKIYAQANADDSGGKGIAKILQPTSDDYFILKPKHSGFHFTPLEILLEELRVNTTVITGIAGNICVLFTAHDAHMRNYKVIVPPDCTASNSAADNAFMISQLKKSLKLSTPMSTSIRISKQY